MNAPVDGTLEYEETGLLAEGGMATLTQATTKDGRCVVVKRVRPPFCFDAGYLRLFRDEGRIHAALQHDRVVRLLDQGEDDGGPYLVFEHVDGTDLAVLLEAAHAAGASLPLEFVLGVFIPLTEALAFVHEATGPDGACLDVVHRDISPGNILLAEDGSVKLADFGVAASVLKSEVTVAGEMKGKFAYMAPEQTRGERVSARADLFALGIVMWECLGAKRLFDGPTDADVVQAVRTSEAPALSSSLPDELHALLRSLLHKDIAQRPSSARVVHAQLRDIALSQGLDEGLSRVVAHAVRQAPKRTVGELSPDVRRKTRRVREVDTAATRVVPEKRLQRRLLASVGMMTVAVATWVAWPRPAAVNNTPAPTPTIDDGMTFAPNSEPMNVDALDPRAGTALAASVTAPITAPITGPIAAAQKPPRVPVVGVGAKDKVAAVPVLLAAAPVEELVEGTGKLSISSEPWARVTIDGTLVDEETPLVAHELPAGKHTVVLENPVHGLKKTIVVSVPRDGHLRQPVNLLAQ
jgi:eukaryotic-like serine/threonine-protein kinase